MHKAVWFGGSMCFGKQANLDRNHGSTTGCATRMQSLYLVKFQFPCIERQRSISLAEETSKIIHIKCSAHSRYFLRGFFFNQIFPCFAELLRRLKASQCGCTTVNPYYPWLLCPLIQPAASRENSSCFKHAQTFLLEVTPCKIQCNHSLPSIELALGTVSF